MNPPVLFANSPTPPVWVWHSFCPMCGYPTVKPIEWQGNTPPPEVYLCQCMPKMMQSITLSQQYGGAFAAAAQAAEDKPDEPETMPINPLLIKPSTVSVEVG